MELWTKTSRELAALFAFVLIISLVLGRGQECLPLSISVAKYVFVVVAFYTHHLFANVTMRLFVCLYVRLFIRVVDVWLHCLTSEENWEFFLKMHLEWRCEYLKEKWNPHENKDYK